MKKLLRRYSSVNYLIQILKWLYFALKTAWIFLFRPAHKSLVIVPHEGLGDLVALIPALNSLSKKHEAIFVLGRKSVWTSVNTVFSLPNNVFLIPFYNPKTYKLSRIRQRCLREKGYLLKLGHFGWDPIFDYPNSFYLKLGLRAHISENKLDFLMPCNTKLPILAPYDYINISTSVDKYHGEGVDSSSYLRFVDSCTVKISSQGVTFDLEVNESESLQRNLIYALNARRMILSDAGFYNIIIRLITHPPITVITRPHTHSHNNSIYPNDFDGGVHEIPCK